MAGEANEPRDREKVTQGHTARAISMFCSACGALPPVSCLESGGVRTVWDARLGDREGRDKKPLWLVVVSLPGCRGELWSGCGANLAGTICSHTAGVRTSQAPWLNSSTAQPLAEEETQPLARCHAEGRGATLRTDLKPSHPKHLFPDLSELWDNDAHGWQRCLSRNAAAPKPGDLLET